MASGSNKTAAQTKGSASVFIAYGFDKAGFHCPKSPVEVDGVGAIRFVGFTDPDSLDEAEGVIIPSGIFEKFEKRGGYGVVRYRAVVDLGLLMEREKHVRNLLKDGKWVCFLVGAIIDRPNEHSDDASDTDLCKRFLNSFGIARERAAEGLPVPNSLCREFEEHIRNYGIAKTVFRTPSSTGYDCLTIAKYGAFPVAFEVRRNAFFLPCHTTHLDSTSITNIVRGVVEAVSKYRQNRNEDIPEWADAFEFAEESSLKREREELKSRLAGICDGIERLRINKSILVSSGDALRDRLVSILRDYFGLTIDPLDEHREDAKVVDDQGNTLVLLEFKAMGSGVGREDVSQINFHRDRAKLPEGIPGVLIANCNRKVTDIAERLAAQVDGKQIQYARNQNVLIVRTIDLLCLMRQMETKGIPERRAEIRRLFSSGGGWLKATETTYEIVTA